VTCDPGITEEVNGPISTAVTEAHLRSLVLQAFEQFVESDIPTFESLRKIPAGRLGYSIRKRNGAAVDGVERSYKRSNKRLEKFDKHRLECAQKVVNVCELEDALVCDLKAGKVLQVYAQGRRNGGVRQR
jgi:hypothetical protein